VVVRKRYPIKMTVRKGAGRKGGEKQTLNAVAGPLLSIDRRKVNRVGRKKSSSVDDGPKEKKKRRG